MDDVIVNKVSAIERCLERVREVHRGDHATLDDPTLQDSIVLNLQRACEASIDLGMHLVRRRRLGVPQDSREVFEMLVRGAALDAQLAQRLQRMVGFRNIAVHDYRALNLAILGAIIDDHLSDLLAFARWALAAQEV